MEMAVRGGPGTEIVVVDLVVPIIVSPISLAFFVRPLPGLNECVHGGGLAKQEPGLGEIKLPDRIKEKMFIVVGYNHSFNSKEEYRNKNRSQSVTKQQHNPSQQEQLQQHYQQQ